MDDVLPSAERVIAELGLVPHPEGGHFVETFRSSQRVTGDRRERAASTAIYFLLREGEFSAFHRVRSDEVWHHYLGDSLELHRIAPDAAHSTLVLGSSLSSGERPQAVVLAGQYQAARVVPARYGFTLCGCTVAPGFEFADFEMPSRAELCARFPQLSAVITALTR